MDLDEARVGKSLADRSLDGERERNKPMSSSMPRFKLYHIYSL